MRLEHLLVPNDCPRWSAPACVVCETMAAECTAGQPRRVDMAAAGVATSSAVRQLWTRDLRTHGHLSAIASVLPASDELVVILTIGGHLHCDALRHRVLSDCPSLTSVDLSGLREVQKIGSDFLSRAISLRHLSTAGLSSVTEVGSGFLRECDSLESIDASQLTALTSVGADFMRGCGRLCELDLGAAPISTVGARFLSSCTGLLTLTLHSVVVPSPPGWLEFAEALYEYRTTVDGSMHRIQRPE